MTSRPIPGAWYYSKSTEARWVYLPSCGDDTHPWREEHPTHGLISRLDPPSDLEEVYNPHPPTRTEWAYLPGDGSEDPTCGSLNYLFWLKKTKGHGRVTRREVTEWVEIAGE